VIKVYFSDGSFRTLSIPLNTTSEQVINIMVSKMPHMKPLVNSFSLAEVSEHDKEERYLKNDDCPLEVIKGWKSKDNKRLVISMKKAALRMSMRLNEMSKHRNESPPVHNEIKTPPSPSLHPEKNDRKSVQGSSFASEDDGIDALLNSLSKSKKAPVAIIPFKSASTEDVAEKKDVNTLDPANFNGTELSSKELETLLSDLLQQSLDNEN